MLKLWLPTYQVVSKVNKYYVPSNVELNTTIKSDDKMVREFVFLFDEEFDRDTIKKMKQKEDTLFEEYKKLIDISYKNKKDNTRIIWKIKGSAEEVNKLCELSGQICIKQTIRLQRNDRFKTHI